MANGSKAESDKITVQPTTYASIDVLEKEYANAISRIEHQHEILTEFSREGMKMFRILILFVAVPATIIGAFSFDTLLTLSDSLLSSDIAVSVTQDSGLTNQDIFITTVTFIILSVGFHVLAAGQEFRGIRNQTNPADIDFVVDHDISEESYLRMKLKLLRNRIKENRKTLGVIESILAVGKLFTLIAVGGVGILLYNIASGRPLSVFLLLGLIIIIVAALVKFPSSYLRSDTFFSDDQPYEDENVELKE
jgi:hypothetical protein